MKKEDFIFLVEHAVKAPSGHNTQPWKFENTDDGIVIHPDFSRALPVVDKENYELYISLGCALENLIIAATQRGYQFTIEYPDTDKGSIHVKLVKDVNSTTQADKLFEFIAARQVTKVKYNSRMVEPDDLQRLKSCFSFDGVSLMVLDGKENFKRVMPIIIEANNQQFGNKEFVNELISWIRFTKREAERTKDGIWSATMGMPGFGKFLGSIVMGNFVTAKSEAKRLSDLLDHTQGIAVFFTDTNDVISWVKTGQAFQRFGLFATMLGISHAHLNMPCEELGLRGKLANELSIEKKHPLLLIRYGYAEKMPYSYRRSHKDVIVD